MVTKKINPFQIVISTRNCLLMDTVGPYPSLFGFITGSRVKRLLRAKVSGFSENTPQRLEGRLWKLLDHQINRLKDD